MKYIIKNYFNTLINLFLSAKRSIYGTIYITSDITKSNNPKLKKLFIALFEKARQGIKIELHFNYKTPSYNLRTSTERIIDILKSKNIKASFCNHKKMLHAKAFIIDQEIIIVGSHNLTMASDSKNIELSLIIKNKDEAEKIERSLKKLC
jgi:phosphatidylserine/phosphatidylglycerophosphate/cardiolipin synthase-like enzyme